MTNPRIFKIPTPKADAVQIVAALMESPSLRLLTESPGYWDVFSKLVIQGNISGARIHDARVAALCIHGRVKELWTADRDFSRFPSLPCRNPLVEAP